MIMHTRSILPTLNRVLIICMISVILIIVIRICSLGAGSDLR